jgi:hypothetical protein
MWAAHSSLKGICTKLCFPEFHVAGTRKQTDDVDGYDSYMPKSTELPTFGVKFSPMLSSKTGFDRLMHNISGRHRSYLQSEKGRERLPDGCLAFRHPAFAVEPKLDGERFLVHVNRAGIVKMQTRNGNWYR